MDVRMMLSFEYEGESHGLPIYVWYNRMGFRCGYVAIPESHPLCGVYYDDVPEDVICCVHGGLTYSGNLQGEAAWAFGFDCAHLGDAPDDSIASNELSPMASYVWDDLYAKAHVWKLDEVIKECGKLAEKLSAIF